MLHLVVTRLLAQCSAVVLTDNDRVLKNTSHAELARHLLTGTQVDVTVIQKDPQACGLRRMSLKQ